MLNLKKTILICFLLVFASVNLAWGLTKSRFSARYKSCLSNIRILQGTVEMYNMDHSTQMDDIDEESMQILVKENYLKSIPQGTESSCKYTVSNKLSENGVIYCEYHGGADIEKFPPNPEVKEKIESQKRWSRIMELQESFGIVIFLVFCIFVIIGIIRVIVKVVSILLNPKKNNQQREKEDL